MTVTAGRTDQAGDVRYGPGGSVFYIQVLDGAARVAADRVGSERLE